jgi:hypothetical protein
MVPHAYMTVHVIPLLVDGAGNKLTDVPAIYRTYDDYIKTHGSPFTYVYCTRSNRMTLLLYTDMIAIAMITDLHLSYTVPADHKPTRVPTSIEVLYYTPLNTTYNYQLFYCDFYCYIFRV